MSHLLELICAFVLPSIAGIMLSVIITLGITVIAFSIMENN